MKDKFDVLAIGACYIDINVKNFPFENRGILPESELVGSNYDVVGGGSAVNFCRLLQKLEIKTAFLGMSGDDDYANIIESSLQKNRIKPMLIRQKSLLTNVSFNMTNPRSQHIMLTAGTANASLNPLLVMPRLSQVIKNISYLYLGGCFKLVSFIDSFKEISILAKNNNCYLIIDHGRIPVNTTEPMKNAIKELVLSASHYFPSKEEFLQLWEVSTIEEGLIFIKERATELIVVVKDGKNGAYFIENGKVINSPAFKVEKISNVTGAGDTFNAGVIAGLCGGKKLKEAVQDGCGLAAKKISGKVD